MNASATTDQGVVFPVVDGRRSTTATGRGVFAEAARVVDPALADEIEQQRDWRSTYLPYARRLLETSLTTRHDPAALARAGLDALYGRMEFVRAGLRMPLIDGIAADVGTPLHTIVVEGHREIPPRQLSVPYRGDRLSGDRLHRQLDRWTDEGVCEPTFAEAIRQVMANPEWLDLTDQTVVVLGAGAEMGPLHSLCRWRATVVPVDLPRPAIWQRIIGMVRAGAGRALVPSRTLRSGHDNDEDLAAVAGVDLTVDLPEVAQWLRALDGPLTVGNYVYADGATHVRVSMGVDAITAHLLGTRDDVALAVLATPTDVFAVPEDVVEWSRRAYADQGLTNLVKGLTRTATRGRLFAPNYQRLVHSPDGPRLGIADCLVAQQGPNYALAKRLQRWRATVARHEGILTSVNVAPPTRTRSVLRNRVLAAAYAGAGRFGVEVFDPSTSNTLMAAMLVHDLRNPASVAHPRVDLAHPQQLFWEGANHGGLWRSPYAARSVLGLAVVLGMVPRGA